MKSLSMLLTLFLSLQLNLLNLRSEASTFVGNGGNAGDLELQVTIAQIKRSLLEMRSGEFKRNQLCTCDEEMEGHKICETLKALSIEQKNFCEKTLVHQSSDLLDLISGAQSMQIQWTSQSMQVEEKFGSREAEGVAIPNERKVFLNREQFLDLRDYERIFLVTHEMGHLVKFDKKINTSVNVESKYLRDDEVIGPFKQSDGGRQLLNSLGAAVAMKSLTNGGVDDYSKSLKRSKNYKQHWFNISVANEPSHNDESTFAIKNYSGYQASYRYQITQDFGIGVEAQYLKAADTFLQSVRTENELQLSNVQMNYRIFPFKNPLSFWGQSFLNLAVGYGAGTAKMKVYDDYTSANEEAKISSPIVSVQYYFPSFFGLWFTPGVQLSSYHYEFSQIGFKSESSQFHLNLGVSYAF